MDIILPFILGALFMLGLKYFWRHVVEYPFYRWLARQKNRKEFIRLHGAELGAEYAGEFWDKENKAIES